MDVTYYVAPPFVAAGRRRRRRRGSRMLQPECRRDARRGAVHVGAVAFSRTGDSATGDFGGATVIRKFGEVPDDLSAL
jgi:hypothetical protein